MGRLNWEQWRTDNPKPEREWARSPCPRCGAVTVKEASQKCRPTQLPSGEYECPRDDEEAPTYFGFLHDHSPEIEEWNGKFWGAVAYDEGYTDQLD
ncbi:hypothetical protein RA27_02085 [Ruegeria sp. ANG-R]|uniref:hypothetical protein n=1 Tax=Ruegeria sp. ANG-R TaxID=1577903 RepID=UPI00057F0570|nr:hypothetical protein [Ruegeria sp. ANG-R]KIC42207.1 hypothetical protein RA27_02085 [Ruegeria sp. ANG-R]